MSNLIRWDPFREMMTLRNAMDQLFESAFVNPSANWAQVSDWDLALDVAETENAFQVKASLPGIDPKDLEITYTNNVLTIKGETTEAKEAEDRRYLLRERRFGSFVRSISLPSTVDSEHIEASYEAGVLTLHLPKIEEAKPRRIQVRSESPKMIEGKAADITSKN
ncbi:MAG: Hsp20/alpha crystallin family protein [Chloroflexota bacterium]